MKNEMVTRSQIRSIELYFEGRYELAQRAGITVAFDAETKKWFTAPDWWFQIYQVTYRASSFGAPNISPILRELTPSEMQNRDFYQFATGVQTVRRELLRANPEDEIFELSDERELLSGTLFELWQNGNVLMQQSSSYLKETGRLLQKQLKKEIEKWQNDTAEEMPYAQNTENRI